MLYVAPKAEMMVVRLASHPAAPETFRPLCQNTGGRADSFHVTAFEGFATLWAAPARHRLHSFLAAFTAPLRRFGE